MLQVVFMVVWLALVCALFRANLRVAREALQPMKRDRERVMAAGELARDDVLRGVAQAANAVRREMARTFGIGKFAFVSSGPFFWSSYAEWQTYLLLVPAACQAFLHWATSNHIQIIHRRMEQLSPEDCSEVERLRKLI